MGILKYIYVALLSVAIVLGSSMSAKATTATDSLAHKKSVGVVLSGGGAKGFSHLGVLKVLEENNIPIDYICGTSMGAIIAALYASGYSIDQMIEIFKSKDFRNWSNGLTNNSFAKYYYQGDYEPIMFSVKIEKSKKNSADTNKVWKFSLPNSIVESYPMDEAVIELFAPAAHASKYNFDSLMIPFFCISSDIRRHQQLIMRQGDLGLAVRASMAFPMAYSPVPLDSLVLFDGGLYNNFPWKELQSIHHPDLIIGSKCVTGDFDINENDIISLINGISTIETNYNIPDSLGFVISPNCSNFSTFDFSNPDPIIDAGYNATQLKIEEIKRSIEREETKSDREQKRTLFKKKIKPLRFSDKINIEGEISEESKRFINRTIRGGKRENFSIDQFRDNYIRVSESGITKRLYPSYFAQEDSLIYLNLRATPSPPIKFSIGGNISSSSLTQGYLGVSYLHPGLNPWQIGIGAHIGKYYQGISAKFRNDVGVKPLAYYFFNIIGHQFDYFNGNQAILRANRLPKNVQFKELYLKGGITSPITFRRNIMVEGNFLLGGALQSSYLQDLINNTEKPDKGAFTIFSTSVMLKEQTLNYSIYPTSGSSSYISLKYNYINEDFSPGSTNPSSEKIKKVKHNIFGLRIKEERYLTLNKTFSLGYRFDLSWRKKILMSNYYSTIVMTPAYEPVNHASSLLMENFKSYSFVACAISPIIKFKQSFYLHSTIAWFQPYRNIVRDESGWEYHYTDRFPKGGAIANVAIVWQTALGPLSLSTTYYSKGRHKWYPQLNFGFLIFNKKSIDD